MSQRVQIIVDIDVPNHQTPRDAVEWVQHYFSYFHKSLKPQVQIKTFTVTGDQPTPPTPTVDDLI